MIAMASSEALGKAYMEESTAMEPAQLSPEDAFRVAAYIVELIEPEAPEAQ
jgi:hypothetical protein